MTNEEIDVAIKEKQRVINFDIKEFTVELLIQKFERGDLHIPYYQRKYIWPEQRKKKFIESVILGLPIPYLFGADKDEDGRIEIIDGVQRLNTLVSFYKGDFTLDKLEKLNFLDGISFNELPEGQQRRLLNRTIRMIVLDQNCTENDRFDVFERINTTSSILKDSELRKGAYQGEFWKMIAQCADNKLFQELCPLADSSVMRGEREELILRFFAYSDKYTEFEHSVKDFLNDYLKEKNQEFKNGVPEKYKNEFEQMLKFVKKYIGSFAKTQTAKTTPRVRFEAIAVGINLALKEQPKRVKYNIDWLYSEEFKEQTTSDASNNKSKLRSRIEFVKNKLLGS